ncbi:MAG: EipA family protein [Micropepsaceae bacterium]
MEEIIRRLATRRALLTGAAAFTVAACTSSETGRNVDTRDGRSGYPADEPVTQEYRQEEIQGAVENFFGVTAQASAEVVERIFGDLGRPNAYIAGEEAAAAVALGLRYGEGWLYRRGQQPRQVFWTGPSLGIDLGINASKVFTLVYDLQTVEQLFQRIPGVEGSYYFIAGIGVNYLRAGNVTLAPMRTGIGARAGVNVGYLNFTPEREWVPL